MVKTIQGQTFGQTNFKNEQQKNRSTERFLIVGVT